MTEHLQEHFDKEFLNIAIEEEADRMYQHLISRGYSHKDILEMLGHGGDNNEV